MIGTIIARTQTDDLFRYTGIAALALPENKKMVPSYKNISVCVVMLAALFTIPGTATAIPANFVDLGVIGTPGSYTFDTTGSTNANGGNTDTELALWDMSGTLLDSDDDGLGFPYSVITATLSEGMYFLGISEFNSVFYRQLPEHWQRL